MILKKFASYTEEALSLKNKEALEVDLSLEHQTKVERKPVKEEEEKEQKKEEEEKEV